MTRDASATKTTSASTVIPTPNPRSGTKEEGPSLERALDLPKRGVAKMSQVYA